MPQRTQKSDDTSAVELPEFKPASQLPGAPEAHTVAATLDIRTTVTRRTAGELELRFTPRQPPPIAADTSH